MPPSFKNLNKTAIKDIQLQVRVMQRLQRDTNNISFISRWVQREEEAVKVGKETEEDFWDKVMLKAIDDRVKCMKRFPCPHRINTPFSRTKEKKRSFRTQSTPFP